MGSLRELGPGRLYWRTSKKYSEAVRFKLEPIGWSAGGSKVGVFERYSDVFRRQWARSGHVQS